MIFLRKISKTTLKTVLSIVNLTSFTGILIVGIVIQINYHMHHYQDSTIVMGLDRQNWNLIHVVLSLVFATGIILHLIINSKTLGLILMRKVKPLKSKLSISGYLILFSSITAVSGFVSYAFKLAGDDATRLHIMELHDKLAFLFAAYSITHIIQHSKAIVNYLKTWRIHRFIQIPGNNVE